MSALFRCFGLSKSYGGVHALRGVDMEIHAGRVHGLIGPNGAGKSTFIDVASGRTPGGGRVEFDGRDVTGLPPGDRRRLGISRSFQRTSIFPALTVRQQLELAAHWVDAADLGALVGMLGLGHVMEEEAAGISYGQQRLVDLALALVGKPRVLLLDEPAAGLTAQESLALADHLVEIAQRWNVGVLLVEHDMEVVFKVCDVLTVLESGQLLIEGPPAEVRADPRVVRAYFGSHA